VTRLILVAGSIAGSYANGGIAWERISWALGLRRLGFDIVVVDQLDRARTVHPDSSQTLTAAERSYEGCLNLAFARKVATDFGFEDRLAILGEDGESLLGLPYEAVLELAGQAELLLNQAGNLRLPAVKARVARRAFLDLDPGFTQLFMASGRRVPRVEDHHVHFTIGANVGTPRSWLPSGGVKWLYTRQPVLLDEWRWSETSDPGRLTTIAGWRGAGPHGHLDEIGHQFPDKADYFAMLAPLPGLVPQSVEVVLSKTAGDDPRLPLLKDEGWRLLGPGAVADPHSFRSFVNGSGGQVSVAKGAYVETRCGWFSDRDTRYLAAGLPVVAQDTGFSDDLPVGEGLLPFRTLEEAAAAANRIAADPQRHRRAARAIAEEYFSSDEVLTRLVSEATA
jgi:hypothetical protein